MHERLPDLRKIQAEQKRYALSLSGGQVTKDVTAKTELETPEMAASVAELAARATHAGDVWPLPGFVVLNAVETAAALEHWQKAPGSAETQHALTACAMRYSQSWTSQTWRRQSACPSAASATGRG